MTEERITTERIVSDERFTVRLGLPVQTWRRIYTPVADHHATQTHCHSCGAPRAMQPTCSYCRTPFAVT